MCVYMSLLSIYLSMYTYAASSGSLHYLSTRSYRSSLLVSPLDGTQYLHKTDECKFFIVGQQ